MNYRELHRLFELDGPSATVEHVGAALQSGELQPADFSLRELAEAVVPDGREWVRSLDPRGGYEVTEADGVDVTIGGTGRRGRAEISLSFCCSSLCLAIELAWTNLCCRSRNSTIDSLISQSDGYIVSSSAHRFCPASCRLPAPRHRPPALKASIDFEKECLFESLICWENYMRTRPWKNSPSKGRSFSQLAASPLGLAPLTIASEKCISR